MQLIQYLLDNDISISCAESCTGGLLSAKFIENAGVSKIFFEGIVAYSNESKIKRLKVSADTLKKFGAVSEQVAIEMVNGLESDVCISTTGIAGPNSDNTNKPVGLVYIGLKIFGKIKVMKFNFSGSRTDIQIQTVDSAIEFLSQELGV